MTEQELTELVMDDAESCLEESGMDYRDKGFYLVGIEHGVQMALFHLKEAKRREDAA